MMRRVSGLVAVVGSVTLTGGLVLSGCAHRPTVLDEGTKTEVTSPITGTTDANLTETLPPSALAKPAEGVLIREIKVIEDNGQQGVFAKLSRAPRDVNHFTLENPSRIVIDMAGDGGGPTAQSYAVQNPVIESIGVESHDGKTRVTIGLRQAAIPAYTVDDLNDTLVTFIGEPQGTTQPVREQIVFTQRAVPGGAPPPPPPPPAVAAAPPKAPKPAQPPPPLPPRAVARVEAPHRLHRVTDRGGEGTDAGAGQGKKLYFGQPVSLDLKDADIHNVLRLLGDVSKLNIVATDDVQGKVTLRLFDVPWDQALDIILQVMNLESAQDGNVIRISTVKRLREEREELRRAQEAARDVEPLQVAYLQVNYAKAKKLADLISGAARVLPARTAGGAGGRGGAGFQEDEGVLTSRGSVMVDEFTNTLIVRDVERGVHNAFDLVHRLDIQTPQVLIEAKIVETTTDFARDLGVQWGYFANIGPQTGTSTGVNFPGQIGFGGSGLGQGVGGVPFIADFPAATVIPGMGSALDLALGSLNGDQALDIRLTAAESDGKAKIISRPRVVTLNNVASTIRSVTILRVRLPGTGTVVNTGAGGTAGTATTATEKIETGITLVVTPQVSSDGFVLIDLFAKSSTADFTREVDMIPTEIAREATSHILVRDGQTFVLGGIYRDQASDNVRGMPFFMNIPGLGWLFKTTSKQDRREDLLIFFTPRVIGGSSFVKGQPTAGELWEQRNESDIPTG